MSMRSAGGVLLLVGATATACGVRSRHHPDGGDDGSSSRCDGIAEGQCLAAWPDCVPRYDDTCCPTCQPERPCTDCRAWAFERCIPFVESGCTPGFLPSCGQTPGWACNGEAAECPVAPPCQHAPGCVEEAGVCVPQ